MGLFDSPFERLKKVLEYNFNYFSYLASQWDYLLHNWPIEQLSTWKTMKASSGQILTVQPWPLLEQDLKFKMDWIIHWLMDYMEIRAIHMASQRGGFKRE